MSQGHNAAARTPGAPAVFQPLQPASLAGDDRLQRATAARSDPQQPDVHRLPHASPTAGLPTTAAGRRGGRLWITSFEPAAARRWLAGSLLWGTVAGGAAVTVSSLLAVQRTGSWLALIPFLVLAVVAEFLGVQVSYTQKQRLSLSLTIAVTMAAVVVLPLGAALVELAAQVTYVIRRRQRTLDRMLFNLANSVLRAAAASGCYLALLALDRAHFAAGRFTLWHLGAAFAAGLVFHVVNVGSLALMISLHTGRSLPAVIRESAWFGPTHILLGLTGAFLGVAYPQLGLLGITMFVVPVLVLRFTLDFNARRSQHTIEVLQAAKADVEQANHELIATVGSIIDARDNSVAGHSQRVASFAVGLGTELGLRTDELDALHTAGLLHDLGKVGVPEAILHKPARLTNDEYAIMKQHASIGATILADVGRLGPVARMVGEHHEWYDGTGYPHRLAGCAISIGGRILSVADALDSIISDRPYATGRPLDWALAEIDRCAGTQFDPQVVAALHQLVARVGADAVAGCRGLAFAPQGASPAGVQGVAGLAA